MAKRPVKKTSDRSQVVTLTMENVEALKKGETIRDDRVRGLEARGNAKGPATYSLVEWFKGKKTRETIGVHSDPWTPSTARTEVRAIKVKRAQGVDTREEKRAERRSEDVNKLCDEYIPYIERRPLIRLGSRKGLPMKADTVRNYKSAINAHVRPILGKKRLRDLTTADIEMFRERLMTGDVVPSQGERRGGRRNAGGNGAARNALIALAAMLNWGRKRGMIAHNFWSDVEKPASGEREQVLNGYQLFRLDAAFRSAPSRSPWPVPPVQIACVKFNLLTGWRCSEVQWLRWSDVDADKRSVTLPDSKTGKSNRMLSSAARDVLCEAEAWRTEPDGFVFPTMQSVGKTNRALRKLCKVGGIDRFTSHVFRHTLGSVAADNDIAYETVEKLLGHRGKRTVTHRYIHRGDVSLKRSADKMGDTLLSLMGEEPTDTGSNVVKLPGVA